MSIGGRSLHKEDYLKLALLGGGATVGLGAFGVGPAAGLFGSAGAAAAGAAAPGEAIGAFTGTAADLPGLLGGGKGLLKGLDALQKANTLVGIAQGNKGQAPMMAQRPQPQMPMYGDAMKYWQQIYGGLA